jgi:hypothetical protein
MGQKILINKGRKSQFNVFNQKYTNLIFLNFYNLGASWFCCCVHPTPLWFLLLLLWSKLMWRKTSGCMIHKYGLVIKEVKLYAFGYWVHLLIHFVWIIGFWFEKALQNHLSETKFNQSLVPYKLPWSAVTVLIRKFYLIEKLRNVLHLIIKEKRE